MSCETPKVYVGDIGTIILLDTGVDISAGSVFEIKVKKPDNTTATWTATLYGQSQVKYIAQSGDLNVAGTYLLQAKVTMPGWTGLGETASFEVLAVFT